WISPRITSSPNVDQYSGVSTTISPVTHNAEIDVNSAVTNPVASPDSLDAGRASSASPDSLDAGRASSTVPPAAASAKPTTTMRAGCRHVGSSRLSTPVRTSRGAFGAALGRPLGVEHALLVHPAVRVRAEVVALALHERRGQPLGAQRVVVGQCRGEA